MRQSKTRTNFFKPRYNLVLKTKSILWSNMFKMRKVIKKRKWRSVFFNFRTLKILEPSPKVLKLNQIQNSSLLYNPFSIFIKKKFKFYPLNNSFFFKNKTRLNYLNLFLKLSNKIFNTFGKSTFLKNESIGFKVIKKLYNTLYNFGSQKLELPQILKKVNYFFNFLKKNLELLNEKKNFSKHYNFKKFAILRKTNNFQFFVNYRDYIENEVFNSIFFSRGRFRNTKNLDDEVFTNKMSSIFINNYAIKLTKLKVIRNFFAINSLKKIKKMLNNSMVKGKRFLLQQKFSQQLLLKMDTVVHTLKWSNSILGSKQLLNNNEIFLNHKIMKHRRHVLKPGDLIQLKKNRINVKHINIDPRIKKLATMKKTSRKYVKLFQSLLNRFKSGYRPTGTSIWYFFKRDLAFKNKYFMRLLKRRGHSKLISRSFKKKKKTRPHFNQRIFFDSKLKDFSSKMYLFRGKKHTNTLKMNDYQKRKHAFSKKTINWPLFLGERRKFYLTSVFKKHKGPSHYIHKFDQFNKRVRYSRSAKIEKYNNYIGKFHKQYKRFFSKYPRISFLKNNKNLNNFYSTTKKNLFQQKPENFISTNMHLLVPFGFIQNRGLKTIYPTAFQMKRRKIIFSRLDRKKTRQLPFQTRCVKTLRALTQYTFLNQLPNQKITFKNIAFRQKLKQTDALFFKKYNAIPESLNINQKTIFNLYWYHRQKTSQNKLIGSYSPLNINSSFLLQNFGQVKNSFISNNFSKFYMENLQNNQGLLNYFKQYAYTRSNHKFKNIKNQFINLLSSKKIKNKLFKKYKFLSKKKYLMEKHRDIFFKNNPKFKKIFNNELDSVFLRQVKKKYKPLRYALVQNVVNKKQFNTRLLLNLKILLMKSFTKKTVKIKNLFFLQNQKTLIKKLLNKFLIRKKYTIIFSQKSKQISKYYPEPRKRTGFRSKNKLNWQNQGNLKSLFGSFWLPKSYNNSIAFYKQLKKNNTFVVNKTDDYKINLFIFLPSYLQTKLHLNYKYKNTYNLLTRFATPHFKKISAQFQLPNQNLIQFSYNLLFKNDMKLNLLYRLINNNLELFKKSSTIGSLDMNPVRDSKYQRGLIKKVLSKKIKAPYIEHKSTMALIINLPNPAKDFVRRNSLYINHNNLYRLLK